MAVISIIQRRFYATLGRVAACSGIGWRFGSEWGGDLLRNTHLPREIEEYFTGAQLIQLGRSLFNRGD
jgi:hypothetical protein